MRVDRPQPRPLDGLSGAVLCSRPTDPTGPASRPELEPSPRWVRVRFGGQVVADSKRAMLLRAPGRVPIYYFPREDVRPDSLYLPQGRRADGPGGQ